MNHKHLVRTFQVLTGVMVGLALTFLLLRPGEPGPSSGAESHFLADAIPAPSLRLASHRGDRVGPQDFPEKVSVVFFGYTSCPDVCPLTLSNLKRAFQEMNEDGSRIQVFLVTVDPARDTSQRLRDYLEGFHPSFLGLLGTEEEIRGVANGFGAYFARSGDGPNYTVDHTARIFVVDRTGRIPLTFPVTATPEEMARDLTSLLESRP